MALGDADRAPRAVKRLLEGFRAGYSPLSVGWADWLDLPAPYPTVTYTSRDVVARYERNGFEWDIHGTLFRPAEEVDRALAIVLFHGGTNNETVFLHTPDGRPGLGAVLGSMGFTVLAISYTGHYPPGGTWERPVADRQPVYLLDRDLPDEEIARRNLACTFNVILQGAGHLVDAHLDGRRLLVFGHSTGGPMAIDLHRWIRRATTLGILGWGSGGPDGWRRDWREETAGERRDGLPLDALERTTAEHLRGRHYVGSAEMTPWGGVGEYLAWADRFMPQFRTGLNGNQHQAKVDRLEGYAPLTGLPREEYFGHLNDPDARWLAGTRFLLLVGEEDKDHWNPGLPVDQKREMYMARRFVEGGARAQVVVIPKYTHMGLLEAHSEQIARCWMWAYRDGYFTPR